MSSSTENPALQDEVARLKSELAAAHAKLNSNGSGDLSSPSTIQQSASLESVTSPQSHALLLLSDSALPLGSFAFSSGLESYLAHHPSSKTPPVEPFLSLALETLATTTLPYLLAAYRDPSQLQELDDTLDACILCHVAKRASAAQGRALLTVWERAFKGTVDAGLEAARALAEISAMMKKMPSGTTRGAAAADMPVAGHFAPIWAVVTRALCISIRDCAYVFVLNHAKAVLSAAVRASVVGPYQAQAILVSMWLREEIEKLTQRNWHVPVEDAGQGVPAMDLWIGRHEMLYSRIFNS
ncbi:MAG: hypothetical protein L6R39_002021 [Caloplaca ligustica]|nr:MAG: hypothetical protein L6R39_002021 [Caloplaca ligustica]